MSDKNLKLYVVENIAEWDFGDVLDHQFVFAAANEDEAKRTAEALLVEYGLEVSTLVATEVSAKTLTEKEQRVFNHMNLVRVQLDRRERNVQFKVSTLGPHDEMTPDDFIAEFADGEVV